MESFHYSSTSGNALADGFQKSIVPSSISALLFQMAVHLFCQDVFRDLSYPLLRRRSSTMSSPKTEDWQNAEALRRFQMIAPLMDQTLDSARKTATRRTIADDNGISVKTIRRYESAFRSKGFSGLMPKSRKGSIDRRLPENYSEYVQEAIILKKEVPSRSVSQIITILEGERKAPEGVLKRSTLQRHLYAAGFGEKQMKKYREDQRSTTAVKRFCKPHRMMLAQADIKYGVGILVSADGKKKTAYLSSIIDDHSRYILASEWYEKEDEYAVTDVFRKAILNYGTFDRCYTDNGSVYVSGQLRTSCAKLGIRLIRAKPYSGKSKGIIERFHQTVDQFIAEVKLKKISSLNEINRLWKIFVEEYYHKKPHEGIREYYLSLNRQVPSEGITPLQEWNRDTRQLVFLDKDIVGEAFRFHESRIVDRGGLISFKGRKYEAGASLIGAQVEISYDPRADTDITIHYKEMEPFTAKPVSIGSFCAKDPAVPEAMTDAVPSTSRFLDVIEKRYQETQGKLADAISYSSYRKDGE